MNIQFISQAPRRIFLNPGAKVQILDAMRPVRQRSIVPKQGRPRVRWSSSTLAKPSRRGRRKPITRSDPHRLTAQSDCRVPGRCSKAFVLCTLDHGHRQIFERTTVRQLSEHTTHKKFGVLVAIPEPCKRRSPTCGSTKRFPPQSSTPQK